MELTVLIIVIFLSLFVVSAFCLAWATVKLFGYHRYMTVAVLIVAFVIAWGGLVVLAHSSETTGPTGRGKIVTER